MIVYFVCTANVCRSPMAQGILADMITRRGVSGVSVKSAGVMVPRGIGVSTHSADVAAVHDIDISGHVPRQITGEMVSEADLILVMEYVHKALLVSRFPEAADKIYLLKEYGTGGYGEIDDPVGFGRDVYASVYSELDKEITRISPLIEESARLQERK